MPSTISLKSNQLSRPQPPGEVLEVTGRNLFIPAPELAAWVKQAYLHEDGPLFTEEHAHLAQIDIGCLWTNAENSRQKRRIVGQAELGSNIGGRMGKWTKARAEFQLEEWFGFIPDFLLTFDALYAADIDDASFAALVDHELFHCAQDTDRFGMPAFVEATGLPKCCIRGHDVEEFTSVVRRFGIEAAGPNAVEMVIAAAQRPEIGPAKLAQGCGTCLRLAA